MDNTAIQKTGRIELHIDEPDKKEQFINDKMQELGWERICSHSDLHHTTFTDQSFVNSCRLCYHKDEDSIQLECEILPTPYGVRWKIAALKQDGRPCNISCVDKTVENKALLKKIGTAGAIGAALGSVIGPLGPWLGLSIANGVAALHQKTKDKNNQKLEEKENYQELEEKVRHLELEEKVRQLELALEKAFKEIKILKSGQKKKIPSGLKQSGETHSNSTQTNDTPKAPEKTEKLLSKSEKDVTSPLPSQSPRSPKAKLFISYSRADSQQAQTICSLLKKLNVPFWIDVDNVYSGENYKKKIVKEMRQSDGVIFLSSQNANASTNVRKEISLAVNGEKYIIPLKLDDTPYADEIEYDLSSVDYIDYAEDSQNDFPKLRKAILENLTKPRERK